MKKRILLLICCIGLLFILSSCGKNNTHVKIIAYQNPSTVEEVVNDWLDENKNVEIIDIQITSRNYEYVVMITYKGDLKE